PRRAARNLRQRHHLRARTELRGARAPLARAGDRERGRDREATRARKAAARPAGRVRLLDRQRRRRACRRGAPGDRPTGIARRRYHGASMIHPRIDELLDTVDSRYALVIVAAKRARQINDYHHQLGEGIGFEQAPPPLVESRSKNYLTMALEEISEDKLKYKYPK